VTWLTVWSAFWSSLSNLSACRFLKGLFPWLYFKFTGMLYLHTTLSTSMAPASSSVDTEKTKHSCIPSTRLHDVANDAELVLSSHWEARIQAQRAHNAEAVPTTLAPSTATTSVPSRKHPSTSVADADEDDDVV
jgi:hypothetical protein